MKPEITELKTMSSPRTLTAQAYGEAGSVEGEQAIRGSKRANEQ